MKTAWRRLICTAVNWLSFIALQTVLDAIVQGSRVRVVTERAMVLTAAQLVGDGGRDVEITPVAPRFEDSFVTLLKGSAPSVPMFDAHSGPPVTPARRATKM